MIVRRRARYVAALGVVAVLAGCGTSGIKLGDQKIANADEFLASADALFEEAFAGTDADVAAVASDARCYFEDVGEDQIGDQLYCGPVRYLGYDDPWFTIGFDSKVSSEGDAVLADPFVGEYASPTGQLFRSDGEEPSDPADLAAPEGPRTTEKDFAVLLPIDALPSVKLTPVESPAELREPAATVTVPASGELTHLPDAALAALGSVGSGDGADYAPIYRPAEGQTLSAWRVDVTDPPDLAPALDDSWWGAPEGLRDASLSLAVQVGDQRLAVVSGDTSGSGGGLGAADADGVAKIACESVPCPSPGSSQYVLVVSASSDETPSLVATTDGEEESVPLAGGDVVTEHSTAAYEKSEPRQQVSQSWGTKTFEVVSEKAQGDYASGPISLTYGGEVASAFFTPFEAANGWAPEGKAWLVVPLSSGEMSSDGGEESIDWPSSWTVKYGKETVKAQPKNDSLSHAVFPVDVDATDFTVSFRPVGSVEYTFWDSGSDKRQKSFTAPEALTFEVTFS